MRKILFRGKHKDNGQWIYWNVFGRITTSNGKGSKFTAKRGGSVSYYYHIDQILEKIDHATIGQYTGLTDKDGKKIFEGDIMRNPGNVVEWCNGGFCINGDSPLALWTSTKIIGNIHDNPELLKGGADNV